MVNRQQTVTIETFQSDLLHTGPLSVCQGSTLSGLLYLVYTLDYPLIFDTKILKIEEFDESNKPKINTFVDDSIVKIKLEDDPNKHNNQVEDALKTVNNYMNANSLVLNRDKSKILVITNNSDIRDNSKVKVPDKEDITPVRNMVYLGIQVQDDLKWNYFITDSKDNLVKRLKNKINAIKMIRRYLSTKTTKMIFNKVFMSTLLYGATLWQGAPLYLKKKIQSLQLEAARTTIGKKLTRWSTLQLLKEMNWIPEYSES